MLQHRRVRKLFHPLYSGALLITSACCSDVLLRKTHGRVFPWDPPEFGITPDTLVTLAERLRDEVRVIASSLQAQPVEKKDHSPHSSPESVVLPLLEDRKKLADMEFYSSFA